MPRVYMTKPSAIVVFKRWANPLRALDAATLEVTAASLSGNGFQTLPLPGIKNPIAIQSFEDSQNRQLLDAAGGERSGAGTPRCLQTGRWWRMCPSIFSPLAWIRLAAAVSSGLFVFLNWPAKSVVAVYQHATAGEPILFQRYNCARRFIELILQSQGGRASALRFPRVLRQFDFAILGAGFTRPKHSTLAYW